MTVSASTLSVTDVLMADLPDFATMPPCLSDFSTMPRSTHPSTKFGAMPPRPSVFATTDGDKLQRLQDKNKNKNKNSKKSTITWVNHLQRWKEHKGITGTLLNLNKRLNSGGANEKKKLDPVMAEEEEQLWENGALGYDNAESLNHSLLSQY